MHIVSECLLVLRPFRLFGPLDILINSPYYSKEDKTIQTEPGGRVGCVFTFVMCPFKVDSSQGFIVELLTESISTDFTVECSRNILDVVLHNMGIYVCLF